MRRETADTEAGVNARGIDMDAEAAHLRERARELRTQLQEVRGEASSLSASRCCSTASAANAANAAGADGMSAIEGLNEEAHELAARMYGVANQRNELRVRLVGLETERQYQEEDHQRLQEQLLAKRRRRRALSKRLVALCADLENHPRECEEDVDSFGSEEARSRADMDQMSVDHALQLANWAATRCRQADEAQGSRELESEAASPPRPQSDHDMDDSGFEQHLHQLQAALSMLQRDEPKDASEFDAPLSELTEALVTLSRQASVEASGGATAAMSQDAVCMDGGSAFAKPIADLQEAIVRLSPTSQERPTSTPSNDPLPENLGADLLPATPTGNAAGGFGTELPHMGLPVLPPLSRLVPLSPIQTMILRKYQGIGTGLPPSSAVR